MSAPPPMPPEAFDPEQIIRLMSSPQFLSPERAALVKQVSQRLARDPEFLNTMQRALEAQGADFDRLAPTPRQLETFGWPKGEADLVSAKHAAAAAAAGAAALAAAPAAAAV